MDETKVQIGEDVLLDIGIHSDWYISSIGYDGESVDVALRRKADRNKEWWLADTPQTDYPCNTCANKGDHDGECSNCVSDSETIRWKTPSHYKPKDEPQKDVYDSAKFSHNCIGMCENPRTYMAKVEDEPQTERRLPDYSYEADLGRRIMEQTERESE